MEREITHSCGHAQRHYVGGFYVADRHRAAVQLARRRCDACRRAAATDDAMRAGGEAPAGEALPQLAGSPRQVAWAERIRREQLAALGRYHPDAVEGAAAVTDARWWIEHRRDDASTIGLRVGAGR